MELYKWTGTRDGAIALLASQPTARLAYLTNDQDEAVVLYEAESGPALPGAEAYHVLNAVGDINGGFFAVFNNIPVSQEGREIFEQRFQNRAGMVEQEPGFAAIRVLRPLETDTYVILTIWDSEEAFKNWQASQAYGKAHAKRGTAEGIDSRPNIFPRPSFVTTYKR